MADLALPAQDGVDPLFQAGGGLDQQPEVLHEPAAGGAGRIVVLSVRGVHPADFTASSPTASSPTAVSIAEQSIAEQSTIA
ncbi:hypothetical protein GCM10010309_65880 [Streptomyces violaceochromogenes]|nr:hypothetical protein GCM10010309_65880 [Streptomyces violaceochromogenes]